VKKKKDDKKRSIVFVWIKAKKNECIRSTTIEDLPLLAGGGIQCKQTAGREEWDGEENYSGCFKLVKNIVKMH
jgi:hypothetical protein